MYQVEREKENEGKHIVERQSGETFSLHVTVGDFRQFGCILRGKKAVFTFEAKKTGSLVLYDKKTGEFLTEILADMAYRIGKVFSLSISGPDWSRISYLLRVDGDLIPDPYARIIVGREKWNDPGRYEKEYQIRCCPILRKFSWKGQEKSGPIPAKDAILLRLHMRGFTMQTNLSEEKRGNFRGLMAKLPALKAYGITMLEFQPLYDFEEIRYEFKEKVGSNRQKTRKAGKPIGVNYWGYGEAQYFAPKASYFSDHRDRKASEAERRDTPDLHMKEMVRAIHQNGMKIIMEMNLTPPYMKEEFVLSCLRFWAEEYHIDGFRLIGISYPFRAIAEDPFLSNVMILSDQIPEDLLNQEDKDYRHFYIQDDSFLYPVRRLQNHMEGSLPEFANMMRRQNQSYGFVNAVASTFGFTLMDAYSYSEKHNEANGEENRDGLNVNFSHNYGVEGPTNSSNVLNLRLQHIRTALSYAILSQGIPMIQAGDSWGNSQSGNNNAYCQDNEIGWVTWSGKKIYRDLHRYIKRIIDFRRAHPILSKESPMQMSDYRHLGLPDLSYHGREPWTPWLSNDRKSLGILYFGSYGPFGQEEDVYLAFNFYFDEEELALPTLPRNGQWFYVTNTGRADWAEEPLLLEDQTKVRVGGGSLTILIGREEELSNPEEKNKEKK
ncbi:hypothetical protein ACKX2L_01890 [Lachnospiraceae bacterium YH-ros2228]